ncbi:MAG TPA: DUF4386 domain-containing protein, partial [Saprospiraceae bacterium]|nr:DUF4386 domain-containing protein [Saprospiraceae bacterium]
TTKNLQMNKIQYASSIGVLFLAAFPAFGVGQYLLESTITSERHIGSLLIVVNSLIVFAIGLLLYKTLAQHYKIVGIVYLITRSIESMLLSLMLLTMPIDVDIFSKPTLYHLAMLILGVGSLPMCLLIWKRDLVPPWLGMWGLLGYGIFAIGFLFELFGKPWSMYFLWLGGLWELFFGVWLIATIGNENNFQIK